MKNKCLPEDSFSLAHEGSRGITFCFASRCEQSFFPFSMIKNRMRHGESPPSEGGTKGGWLNQKSINILTKPFADIRRLFPL